MCRDKRAPQAEASVGHSPSAGLHRRRRAVARRAHGRRLPEDDRGRHSERAREGHHPPIRRQIEEEPVGIGADERHEKPAERSREQRAEAGADRSDEQALGRQLAHDAAARGTDREPHRNLALARAGPRQHQVCDVRACDEEHQTRHRQQHPQGPLVLIAQVGDAGAGRIRGQTVGQITLRVFNGIDGRQCCLENSR